MLNPRLPVKNPIFELERYVFNRSVIKDNAIIPRQCMNIRKPQKLRGASSEKMAPERDIGVKKIISPGLIFQSPLAQ